ncbi:MAG: amidase domain-containing protein, partial [Thermoactinomyces sp.]
IYAEPAGGTFDVPQISEDFANFIVYDREKAVQYAKEWSDPDNPGKFHPDFVRLDNYGRSLGGDCANFVSQMLHAGGLKMNDEWYFDKENKDNFFYTFPLFRKFFRYFSPAWGVADSHYRYFSDKKNGFAEKTFKVSTIEDLVKVEKSGEIKPGDLLYWDFEGDDIIDHATMITDIDKNGYLKYSGHTVDQYNADVYEGLNDFSNVKLHIVKMKDKFQVR